MKTKHIYASLLTSLCLLSGLSVANSQGGDEKNKKTGKTGKTIENTAIEKDDFDVSNFYTNPELCTKLLNSPLLTRVFGEVSYSVSYLKGYYYVLSIIGDNDEKAGSTRLTKMDNSGNILWSRFANRGIYDWSSDIQYIGNSQFATVGRAYNENTAKKIDVLLSIVDTTGKLVRRFEYGDPNKMEMPHRMTLTKERCYLISGTVYEADKFKPFLLKVHPDGNQIWLKTFSTGKLNGFGSDVTLLQNGDYLLSGGQYLNDNNEDAYLVRTDPYGNIIWQKTYASTHGSDLFTGAAQLPNGDILLCGNSERRIKGKLQHVGMAMRVSQLDGSIIWQRFYKRGNLPDNSFYNMTLSADGGMVITGMTSNLKTTHGEFWVVKVDADGNDSDGYLIKDGPRNEIRAKK